MRPIKLTMQAFGPYSKTEVIDFSELGNRTMFVISGNTGSGKTTIFDGISYAIYGKASGEDRNGPELRSQFADNDILTEVTLEFSLRGKTYVINRSPQQEKKKARGEGVTPIGAKAELYMYEEDGNKQLLAANVRDVDEKIKQIMLIDSNQFRQILMIPQGEFRKLLTSDSKEKEAILQRLFHTQLYKRIEEKLKEEASSLKNAVEKQLVDRDLAIRKIHTLFHDDLKGYMEAGSTNDLVIVPALIEEIQHMSEALLHYEKELAEKEAARQIKLKELYEAQNTIKQFEAKTEAQQRKLDLESQKQFFDEQKAALELGKKAILLVQQEDLCTRLKKELTAHEDEVAELEKSHKELTIQVKVCEEALEFEKGKEKEKKDLEESILTLKSIKDEIVSYSKLESDIKSLSVEIKELEEQKLAAENKGNEIENRIKLFSEKKEAIEASKLQFLENKNRLVELKRDGEAILQLEKQVANLIEQETLLVHKNKEFDQLTARYKDAKLLVEELENSWLHGQASLLASRLQDGNPCPVCGSEHHPRPAHHESEKMSNEADLKAAKKQVELLEQEKTFVQSNLYKLQSNVEATSQLLTQSVETLKSNRPHFSVEELQAIKDTIELEQTKLEVEQNQLSLGLEQLEKIVDGLKKLELAKEECNRKEKELVEKHQETKISFAEKNTNFTRLQDIIPESLRSISAFQSEVKHKEEKLKLLEQQLEIAQLNLQNSRVRFSTVEGQLQSIRKLKEIKAAELQVEREVFKERLEQQGFQNYKQYESVRKTESQLQQLEADIAHFRESLRSATDRYNELEHMLKNIMMPNIIEINTMIEQMTTEIKAIDEQKNDLSFKKRENEQTKETIKRLNDEMKKYEERFKIIGNLADISKGNNNLRITFERYVLGSFLDDILREANGRLLKMSSGRFQLLRKMDKSKGNGQSGLELLVIDSYTGQERHVKTLSGGESFKAALALALGLADVVQNYAGGVSLETMFIDEGFGTLDPESLDQAIEALIDIQSSGRLVGIISHVPELKERIDARLEVIASQSGSTTQFQFLN